MASFIGTVGRIFALVVGVGSFAGCVVHEGPRTAQPHEAPPAKASHPAQGSQHPAYLHALSDLRDARANLERKGGDAQMKWDERSAIEAIDHAIDELKRASIDDGKNLQEHPPVDVREPRSGRLHKALEALRTARSDVAREEDNAAARPWKGRAIEHIDLAIKRTEEGIVAAEHAS